MEVVKYLREHGVAKLVEEFAIKVKEYPEGLLVLNYDQIYSTPKAHPVVAECRGLILDKKFNVVSRSFDRFFNYGEQPDTQELLDFNKAEVFEKIDGSLIKIYFWDGVWHISTRGTAFAESEVNGFDITFKDLVLKALGLSATEFQDACKANFDACVTYICEVTSAENRVVRVYTGYKLHYLAARNNLNGQYENWLRECVSIGMCAPATYKFSSVEECISTAKHLKDLDEGYVVYQGGVPICKIKSPVYVAIHNIRGEGLNPKRISQIVLSGESDEYLKYFPKDTHMFGPYFDAHVSLMTSLCNVYESTKHIYDQKEFALTVKDTPYSAVLFQCKKKGSLPATTFEEQSELHKVRMLEHFLKDTA